MTRRTPKDREGIPLAVIKRLPIYYRHLTELSDKEVERISSRELAEKIGVTQSQIRQDLSLFGSFGQQGYGYRVDELRIEIERILGLDRRADMVLVGAGHLGRALANYPNFKKRGFNIIAIFDCSPEVIGQIIGGVRVQDVQELEDSLLRRPVKIGIITTPEDVAQGIADVLAKGGVEGIWNFAPATLRVPDDVVLENVHVGESLMALSFKIEHKGELYK